MGNEHSRGRSSKYGEDIEEPSAKAVRKKSKQLLSIDDDNEDMCGTESAQYKVPSKKDKKKKKYDYVAEHTIFDATEEKRARIREHILDPYKHGGPSVTGGKVTPMMQNRAFFRIEKEDVWYLYNDTQDKEIHARFLFDISSSSSSKTAIKAKGVTSVTKLKREDAAAVVLAHPPQTVDSADGFSDHDGDSESHSHKKSMGEGGVTEEMSEAYIIVYPLETVTFISGKVNGVVINCSEERPLSDEYVLKCKTQCLVVASEEMRDVLTVTKGARTDEDALEMCLAKQTKYIDIFFQPKDESLFRRKFDKVDLPIFHKAGWARPSQFLPPDLRKTAELTRDGVVPHDILEGMLGDSYFMSAIAVLAENPDQIVRIFSHLIDEAKWKAERQLGAHRVMINKHGWWRSVIIDDYLPVIADVPCFARCLDDKADMWLSLLQKAYARVHGSYSSMIKGRVAEALTDLTGFPSMQFNKHWERAAKNPETVDRLYNHLLELFNRDYPIVIETPEKDDSQSYIGYQRARDPEAYDEHFSSVALLQGHGYALLDIRDFPKHKKRMMKLRNPWGTGMEWTGPWGYKSEEWVDYPEIRLACNPKQESEGTFWIEWNDAIKYFHGGCVCYVKPKWYDYRMQGCFFEKSFPMPNMVLEVYVRKPISAMIMIAQRDKAGLPDSHKDSHYSSLALIICKAQPGSADPSPTKRPANITRDTTENEMFASRGSLDFGIRNVRSNSLTSIGAARDTVLTEDNVANAAQNGETPEQPNDSTSSPPLLTGASGLPLAPHTSGLPARPPPPSPFGPGRRASVAESNDSEYNHSYHLGDSISDMANFDASMRRASTASAITINAQASAAAEAATGVWYVPYANSTADAARTSEHLSFVQSREVAMLLTFEPSDKPYYIVPRMAECPQEQKNYIMSLITDAQAGGSTYTVRFKALHRETKIFAQPNQPFQLGRTKDVETRWQFRTEGSMPVVTVSKDITK